MTGTFSQGDTVCEGAIDAYPVGHGTVTPTVVVRLVPRGGLQATLSLTTYQAVDLATLIGSSAREAAQAGAVEAPTGAWNRSLILNTHTRQTATFPCPWCGLPMRLWRETFKGGHSVHVRAGHITGATDNCKAAAREADR